MPKTFDFTQSDTWLHLRPQIMHEIDRARDALEQPVDDAETQRLRGEIRAYRAVISMIESDKAPIDGAAPDYMRV